MLNSMNKTVFLSFCVEINLKISYWTLIWTSDFITRIENWFDIKSTQKAVFPEFNRFLVTLNKKYLLSRQIPLVYLSGYMHKRLGSRFGNLLVWLSLIIGQPLAVMMYYHDFAVVHYGKELMQTFGKHWTTLKLCWFLRKHYIWTSK